MSLRAEQLLLRAGERVLLDRISVAPEPGAITALIGPNGAGKSSLLRCLAGVARPEGGSVSLCGLNINNHPPRERARRLSYLPQNIETPFAFTVAELLCLEGPLDEDHPALEVLELKSLLGRSIVTLSGGERQRAAIARALIGPAPTILLDEPLAHLDMRHALHLLDYLDRRARAGQSIVLSLHAPLLARARAQRIWLLKEGELRFDGATKDLDGATLAEAFEVPEDTLLMFS